MLPPAGTLLISQCCCACQRGLGTLKQSRVSLFSAGPRWATFAMCATCEYRQAEAVAPYMSAGVDTKPLQGRRVCLLLRLDTHR
jgi:hypothetical protein